MAHEDPGMPGFRKSCKFAWLALRAAAARARRETLAGARIHWRAELLLAIALGIMSLLLAPAGEGVVSAFVVPVGALFVAGVLAFLVVLLWSPIADHRKLVAERDEIRQQAARLGDRNESLEDSLQALNQQLALRIPRLSLVRNSTVGQGMKKDDVVYHVTVRNSTTASVAIGSRAHITHKGRVRDDGSFSLGELPEHVAMKWGSGQSVADVKSKATLVLAHTSDAFIMPGVQTGTCLAPDLEKAKTEDGDMGGIGLDPVPTVIVIRLTAENAPGVDCQVLVGFGLAGFSYRVVQEGDIS